MRHDQESQQLAKWLSSQNDDVRSRIQSIPPRVVETVVDYLLAWLENEEDVQVFFDGINVADESDGLAGELYGEDGWIERFSDPSTALD